LTTGGGVEMEKKGEKEKENRAVQKGDGKGTDEVANERTNHHD